jgi:hypothetical protein
MTDSQLLRTELAGEGVDLGDYELALEGRICFRDKLCQTNCNNMQGSAPPPDSESAVQKARLSLLRSYVNRANLGSMEYSSKSQVGKKRCREDIIEDITPPPKHTPTLVVEFKDQAQILGSDSERTLHSCSFRTTSD